MSLREAAQQALEALEVWRDCLTDPRAKPGWRFAVVGEKAMNTLRAALAEPTSQESRQVEPVAYCTLEQLAHLKLTVPSDDKIALYTAPPKREPLTKEQLLYVYNQLPNWGMDMDSISQDLVAFARAVERAHGIGDGE